MSTAPDAPRGDLAPGKTITRYAEFWPVYLRAHRRASTRAWHVVGTTGGMAMIALAAVLADWRTAVAAPLFGYGCAWIGHFWCEGNRPATFGHPLWSLLSDLRMTGLILTRRLDRHLPKPDRS